ncbi:hypothetical protein [Pedobacter endophyticus]|uniref:Lipoprotein n=1 Tax=Pedobacter endophyticus TaxID=2789740 RepID=A0A7S9KYG4_9SPHI|nr:hypothetical protein [Pedobacter endophyticus]QPH39178.1 hypothetical protein IZT61_19315 [Pedobacter endophyticus]
MRTIFSLITCIILLMSGCKKDAAVESEEVKFEKALLKAGFKKVSNTELPKGISPYEFTVQEIADIANGTITDHISIRHPQQNTLRVKSNKLGFKTSNELSVVFGDEEPEEGGIGSKNFHGGTQFYYFVNMNAMVSIGFTLIKGKGWKYTSHRVNISKAESQNSDYGYYDEGQNSGSYDGAITCTFHSSGSVYYSAFGKKYSKPINIYGNSGGGGNPNLIVTTDSTY